MTADEPDNDATLLSPRTAPADEDVTLLAGQDLQAPPVRGSSRTRRRRPGTLPPGPAPEVHVEPGHFGEAPPEYNPRSAPPATVPASPNPTPMDGLLRPPPVVHEPHRRREAARHRRLVLITVVAALSAAALTAAVIGVVALIRNLS